jgi:hypothetical protein
MLSRAFYTMSCEKMVNKIPEITKTGRNPETRVELNISESQMKGCGADGTRSFTERLTAMKALL